MARANYGQGNWPVNGPRALAWLRAEVPKRSDIRGLAADCVRALDLPATGDRLSDWLATTAREEWLRIKATLATAGSAEPAGRTLAAVPVTLPRRTLAEFLRDKRREGCPVCALSPEVRQCLAEAAAKGTAKVPEQVEWLNTDCGAHITISDLTQHRSGRHES